MRASVDAAELVKRLVPELGITAAVGANPRLAAGCRRNRLVIACSLQRPRCGVFLAPPNLGAKLSELLLHPYLQGAEGPHQQGELVSGYRSSFARLVVRHCGLTENSEEVARSLRIPSAWACAIRTKRAGSRDWSLPSSMNFPIKSLVVTSFKTHKIC